MATVDVLPSQDVHHPSFKPIIHEEAPVSCMGSEKVPAFDPAKHLNFQEPSKIWSMRELGFPDGAGVAPVAVSTPFPLFTNEAIKAMRTEVLSDEVWDNCRYSSDIAPCQLRGFAPKYAKFVYDAWKSPETLAIISKIAGIDLIPNMDLEIAHINISVKSEAQKNQELAEFHEKRERLIAEGADESQAADEKPVVGWHTDSYPFVCVLMLSDASSMIGGETALRTGNGEILKVRGPQMGHAVVMQGRYIRHQALRALGSQERITMVTSFRPRSPALPDDSVLTTVRGISDLSELYYQFSEYRFEILEERVRDALRKLRERKRSGKRTDTKALKAFLQEQQKFLARTDEEMVDEDKVVQGFSDQLDKQGDDQGDVKSTPGAKRARIE
ncbi:MAG: hypothetical protein M4579_003591 [Chaenotheca gracillima]|nr:MAG: hypothetical protein M4579_003591 [Chaenotheca gracillima]